MVTPLDIRREVGRDILDYQQALSLLRGYSKPRDRIGLLFAKGELIRVRKGLYVLGEAHRRFPVSRELLANLIYGPSYISLDYALSHHGLIPERVEDVTSVTTGKSRRFQTPLGVFTYRPLPIVRYSPGITLAGDPENRYLIATPEKALVDKVWCDKRFKPTSPSAFGPYLFEDLRIGEAQLDALDRARLASIATAFDSRKINMLVRFLAQRGVASHE